MPDNRYHQTKLFEIKHASVTIHQHNYILVLQCSPQPNLPVSLFTLFPRNLPHVGIHLMVRAYRPTPFWTNMSKGLC